MRPARPRASRQLSWTVLARFRSTPPFGSVRLPGNGAGRSKWGRAGRREGRGAKGRARRGGRGALKGARGDAAKPRRLACHELGTSVPTVALTRSQPLREATCDRHRPFSNGRSGRGALRLGPPEVLPRRPRPFRRSSARAVPAPAQAAFRPLGSLSRPRPPPPQRQPSLSGAMAAAAGDGAAKPLQCAMKLANGAIELDTGNRPRVRRPNTRRGRSSRRLRAPPTCSLPGGRERGRGPGWAPSGTPPAVPGAPGSGVCL